ncbi:MAG TPA: ethanolamine ammonia-lyase subunit EutC [Candidatus Acidoferrales bacterium]
MSDNPDSSLLASDLPEIVRKIRARTPARILVGRAGAAYRTSTQMDLREAHAAARDAVRAELDFEKSFGAAFAQQWQLFETHTQAIGKEEYLLRPDLGRHFDRASQEEIRKLCSRESDLQIAIGDGLSVPAVAAQVPPLLPLLHEGAKTRGWIVGRAFVIHHCRVGILNEIGELLNPRVAVLLIGERPGLTTAESLSAYMAYRPRATHSDADRNLISNIHPRGLNPQQAAGRVLSLAAQMMQASVSGFTLREELPTLS